MPDPGVSVPVGGVGEFDRHIDLGSGRRIMSAASGQDVVYEFLADEAREVVVDDDPLVMPGKRLPRLVEHFRFAGSLFAQQPDDSVVRVQHRDVQLVHEQTHVVAGSPIKATPWLLRGTSQPSAAMRKRTGSSFSKK